MSLPLDLVHQFVDRIPEELQDGIIYVCIARKIVMHRCCCGCGEEVSTRLSPVDWSLTFDGKTVSLDPSIGNWSFSCRSHYWIRRNHVKWAGQWSEREIDEGRFRERGEREQYAQRNNEETERLSQAVPQATIEFSSGSGERAPSRDKSGVWEMVRNRWDKWWRKSPSK